jgi:hypothetical protein
MSRRPLLLLTCVVAVIVGALAYRAYARAPDIGDYASEHAYWLTEIPKEGGSAAYQEMVRRYAALPQPSAHEYAHVFGDALYETEGVDGFDNCGVAYVWGCYHSFIERAVVQKGIGVLDILEAHCKAMPSTDVQECEHGLGHGILSYMGVTHLTDALAECDKLSAPTYGCASGIFMEYLNGNIHENRPPVAYTDEGKYGPCDSVPEADRLVCYRRLPNWWAITFKGSKDERPAFLEHNCLGIVPEAYRSACMIGVGYNETSESDFDPEKGKQICASLQNAGDRTICLYGGVLAIFQNTETRDKAVGMCPTDDVRQCVTAAERILGANDVGLAFPLK